MICLATPNAQFPWEVRYSPAKIQHRRRGRNCQKQRPQQQQQWDVHSSLEAPARSIPPNSPQNCSSHASQRIEITGRFASFTLPLGFRPRPLQRKWDVIDLVGQETGPDTRRSGGTPLNASHLRQSSSKKLTFALPAGGGAFELGKLQSVRKVSTAIRAERISKERRNDRSSDYQIDTEIGDDNDEGLVGDTSMWDSNAEGIRRARFRSKSTIKSEVPTRDRSKKQRQELEDDDTQARSRISGNWTQNQQEQQRWMSDDTESNMRGRFEEEQWDYDAEAGSRNRTTRSRKPQTESSQWWQSNEESAYEYDTEPREASASFPDLFSWVNADIKDAFVFIRWGLPAAVLIVPWLMGNPMMLLVGLSFIPAANKVIFPIASQIFRSVMSGGSPPKPRRKRKQSTASSSSRRSQARRTSAFYEREDPAAASSPTSAAGTEVDLFSSVATTIFGDPNDEYLARKPPRLGGRSNATGSATKRLGGWEDLEEDRARARSERWPIMERGRSSRSEKKIVKREQNIFIRLILALFPFLRFWGGLM